MSDFVTALEAQVNLTALWNIVTGAVSVIAISVLFGFGFRLFRRLLKKLTKGGGM